MSKPTTTGPWRTNRYDEIWAISETDEMVTFHTFLASIHEEALSGDGELMAAAANACMRVNPADPLAAAEAYPEIVEALSDIADDWDRGSIHGTTIQGVWDALAKIGRK